MELDRAIRRLEAHNIKGSVPRLAIMQYLIDHDTHPTVEEVYQALHGELPTLSLTTVYNTLRMFAERGAATLITIDDRRVCYDGNREHHSHFLCKKCGKVFNMPSDSLDPPRPRPGYGVGFRIDEVQIYYKGLCRECNISTVD